MITIHKVLTNTYKFRRLFMTILILGIIEILYFNVFLSDPNIEMFISGKNIEEDSGPTNLFTISHFQKAKLEFSCSTCNNLTKLEINVSRFGTYNEHAESNEYVKIFEGEIYPSGSKNSAVAIIPATIMFRNPVTLRNIPEITDVTKLVSILKKLGSQISWDKKNKKMVIDNSHLSFERVSKDDWNRSSGHL